MKSLLVTIAIFTVQLACAQDISGIWRGSFTPASFGGFSSPNAEDRYKLEVQVEQVDKALTGVTYSYKTTVFYGKSSASGTVNPVTKKVRIEELKIVELKMQEFGFACIMTYYLQYTKNGEDEFLEGKYSSYGEKDSSNCGSGTVHLQRVATSDFHKERFLVVREIKKQQKELLAIAAAEKKTAVVAKARAKPLTKKPASKLPVGAKTSVAAKSPVTPAAKKPVTKLPASAVRPGSAAVKQQDLGAASVNQSKKATVPALSKPPVNWGQAAPKPMTTTNIPDLAKTDTASNKRGPDIRKANITVMPKVLASRENELVKTIVVNSNEVILKIYDNGTIDHDTISVFLDKKLVVSRQMLNITPIVVKLNLDNANPYHEIVMVAENLGDFPPNTSLMVVKAGDKEYEVRITSTEQKNAVIIFKYEKPGQ